MSLFFSQTLSLHVLLMRTTTLKLFVFATDRLRSFWFFLWMSVKDPNTDRRVCLKNKSKVLNKATRLHLQETVISLQLLFSSSPGEFYFVWETNMTIKLVFLQMESGGFIKTNIQKKGSYSSTTRSESVSKATWHKPVTSVPLMQV